MGDIITLSRPPVAACGECPHCPTPVAEIESIAVSTELYYYYPRTDSSLFVAKNTSELFGATYNSIDFYWREIPALQDCSSWYLNYSFPYTTNRYIGVVLRGKIGATLSLRIPYAQYETEYPITTSSSGACISQDSIKGETTDAGYIEMGFTIEEGDVLFANDDGTFTAGYNMTIGDTEFETDTFIVGNNADFELPSPPENTTYYFNDLSFDELQD